MSVDGDKTNLYKINGTPLWSGNYNDEKTGLYDHGYIGSSDTQASSVAKTLVKISGYDGLYTYNPFYSSYDAWLYGGITTFSGFNSSTNGNYIQALKKGYRVSFANSIGDETGYPPAYITSLIGGGFYSIVRTDTKLTLYYIYFSGGGLNSTVVFEKQASYFRDGVIPHRIIVVLVAGGGGGCNGANNRGGAGGGGAGVGVYVLNLDVAKENVYEGVSEGSTGIKISVGRGGAKGNGANGTTGEDSTISLFEAMRPGQSRDAHIRTVYVKGGGGTTWWNSTDKQAKGGNGGVGHFASSEYTGYLDASQSHTEKFIWPLYELDGQRGRNGSTTDSSTTAENYSNMTRKYIYASENELVTGANSSMFYPVGPLRSGPTGGKWANGEFGHLYGAGGGASYGSVFGYYSSGYRYGGNGSDGSNISASTGTGFGGGGGGGYGDSNTASQGGSGRMFLFY